MQHSPLTVAVADADAVQPVTVVAVRVAVTARGAACGPKEPEQVTTSLPAWLVPACGQYRVHCVCQNAAAVATCKRIQALAEQQLGTAHLA